VKSPIMQNRGESGLSFLRSRMGGFCPRRSGGECMLEGRQELSKPQGCRHREEVRHRAKRKTQKTPEEHL
jgi:hypothetical protein